MNKLKEDGGDENDSVILDLFGEGVKKQAEDADFYVPVIVNSGYDKVRSSRNKN